MFMSRNTTWPSFHNAALAATNPTPLPSQNPITRVTSNCIDCHMPRQETNLIVFDFAGKRVKPQVRNHLIKVYSATSPISQGDTPADSLKLRRAHPE